jgi:hypothetical protein
MSCTNSFSILITDVMQARMGAQGKGEWSQEGGKGLGPEEEAIRYQPARAVQPKNLQSVCVCALAAKMACKYCIL